MGSEFSPSVVLLVLGRIRFLGGRREEARGCRLDVGMLETVWGLYKGCGGGGELPFCPTALFPRASLSSLSFPPLTQLQAKEALTPPRNDKNLPLTCLKVPASYQQGLHCSSRPWTLVAVPLSAGSAARILSPLACLLCLWIFLILGGMGLLALVLSRPSQRNLMCA